METRRKVLVATIIGLAAALPCGVSAQAAGARIDSGGSTPAARLRFFLGNWTCEGRRFASPNGPEQPFRATYELTPVLDGAWVLTRYEERASEVNPRPLKIEEHWGFDESTKLFVNRWANNFGSFGAFTAGGWSGDVWRWDAPDFVMAGRRTPVRATFRRVGEREFVSTPSMDDGRGGWVPFAEFRCRR